MELNEKAFFTFAGYCFLIASLAKIGNLAITFSAQNIFSVIYLSMDILFGFVLTFVFFKMKKGAEASETEQIQQDEIKKIVDQIEGKNVRRKKLSRVHRKKNTN